MSPSAPPGPLELVRRVLALESRQGCLDRAAIGGLERFVAGQAQRAGASDAGRLNELAECLHGYGDHDRERRRALLVEATHVLADGPRDHRTASSHSYESDSNSVQSTSAGLNPASADPTPKVAATKRTVRSKPMPALDAPVSELPGIRRPMPDLLGKLGVNTVRDLLFYFPRTHYDYADTSSISRLRFGQRSTLVGTVEHVRTNRTARNIAITTVAVSDSTGTVAVRFFNQPYLEKQFPLGARVAISGEPESYNGYTVFNPKEYEIIQSEDLVHTGRLVPTYGLTKGLFQRPLRKMIRLVVETYADQIEDPLPDAFRLAHQVMPLPTALRQFHFPDDEGSRTWAEQRLAFDELLLIQLGLLERKREWQQEFPDVATEIDASLDSEFRGSLPFALTGAQRRVIDEIFADMARPVPMTRLLQGDVGSGKTVVAAMALLQSVRAGRQGVLMAPTEILAEQHARTLERLLTPFGVRIGLLIGSARSKARKLMYDAAASGEVDVLVGTHAVIQEGVTFRNLGLAITDEQHRFGVEQRASLRQKGLNPHTLAMTATPIPRTLAMTIYGDLDVSVLDEMPVGRLPIETRWVGTPREAYTAIRREVEKGRQAFVVCPVIEDSAESDMRSVMSEFRELENVVFPDLAVGLLHGRMKATEKERMLQAFRAGEFQILVATSVVEVGIDIPNATIMVIRDAHRFGLAQLHQFRGRVGRGGDQAYCILLSDTRGEEAVERLSALTSTENGFELADVDLHLRGPGEFWGTRQSGLPELRVAKLGDISTIARARAGALEILADDPDLTRAEHRALAARVAAFWSQEADLS